jgi:hypothetical protein
MYCASCGTPLTQGLSYCNRCGANLREHQETKTGAISAVLTAIILIGVIGMGIMLGGSLVLRKEAGFPFELVGFFMLFTFLITGMTEFMLIRNLSKLTGSAEKTKYLPAPQVAPPEFRLPQAQPLGEPVSSVTEHTTRTLEHARREH